MTNTAVSRSASRRYGKLLIKLLLLSSAGFVHALQASEVSEDFLEYLGNMESNDDNWTDFAAQSTPTRATEAPPESATPPKNLEARSSSSMAAKPPESTPSHNAKPANAPGPKASK